MPKLFCSTMGCGGRFGNQLFAYAFGMGLARKLECDLYIPSNWLGRKIFKINNPVSDDIIHHGSRTSIDYIPTKSDLDQYQNIDLFGYYQYQDALDFYSRKDVLEWLQFQDWVETKFPFIFNSDIVVHKRRGDYVNLQDRYCSITDKSFTWPEQQAIDETLRECGEVTCFTELTEERPIRDEYCDKEGIGFLPDFMKMVRARTVIRSNSTFSWWPSVLSGEKVWAPVVKDKVGWQDVEFVFGNWPRFIDEKYHPFTKISDLHLKDK